MRLFASSEGRSDCIVLHQLLVRCLSYRLQLLVKAFFKILSSTDTLFIAREGEQHQSDLAS